MPELPEVETTVRGLAPVLEGREITRLVLRRADLRRPFPEDLVQRMTGARIERLGRRAKYGLIETNRGDTMVFHLGMSGRWRIDPPEIGKHDHLLLETADHLLALNDARRFGSVDLVPSATIAQWPVFAGLGPEPLDPAWTGASLHAALRGRESAIKLLLLDQRIVAGLGNIYVCEALNMAGIAPTRPGGKIARARLDRLVESVRDVLTAAIAAGGSTLRDYARPSGELGYFANQWRVYGREGEACACGGTVVRRVDGGRSTFWCPQCQK